MKPLLMTSTRTAAGKTTVGLGIALNSSKKIGYFKPYGDHLVYTKKSLVDMDIMVFQDWLGIESTNEECCLGFDPEKIRSHWNNEEVGGMLDKFFKIISEGKEMVIVESGRNYTFGGLMGVDSYTLAKKFGCDIVIVAEGAADLIVDKVIALKRSMGADIKIRGVVINKVDQPHKLTMEEEIKPGLEKVGMDLLGVLPREPVLERVPMELIINRLNAKLVAGSDGRMDRPAEHVLVGALTADQAMKAPKFHMNNKLLITGGDRVDLIFASMNAETTGIVLTNNILPHPKVMAKADEMHIPILSVPMDTYTTANAVEQVIAEIRPEDEEKKQLIKEMVARELDLKKILEE